VHHGWQLTVDPSAVTPRVATPTDAALLGQRLASGDLLAALDTAAERRWLQQQLHSILSDPTLAAAFVREFSRWADLCNRLGDQLITERHRLSIDPADAATISAVAEIEQLFASLAALYRSRPSQGHVAPYPAEIAEMQPYAAAMFVSNLELDGTTLARAAAEILHRWRAVAPNQQDYAERVWLDMVMDGPNTADILFRLLLATPGACTHYVIRSADDPAALWVSAADPALALQVALAGTAPGNISLHNAGIVIQAWLDYFQSPDFSWMTDTVEGYPVAYRVALAEVVAPYLPQFAATNSDWGGDDAAFERRLRALAMLIDDRHALDKLIDRSQATLSQMANNLGAQHDEVALLAMVGDVLGVIGQLSVQMHVHDAELRERLWGIGWSVATIGTAWLPPLRGIAAGVVVDGTWEAASAHLDVIPNPSRTEAAEQLWLERHFVVILAETASTLWSRGGSRQHPTPPQVDLQASRPLRQFQVDLDAWRNAIEQIGSVGDRKAAGAVCSAVAAVISRWSIGGSAAGR
jgi:hypothetical protein